MLRTFNGSNNIGPIKQRETYQEALSLAVETCCENSSAPRADIKEELENDNNFWGGGWTVHIAQAEE